jgi:ADP-ribose pyrophosphatase YjhB (NUDIX family)
MTVGSDRFRRRLLGGFGRLPAGVRGRLSHLAAPSFTVGALAVIERSDGRMLLVRHSYRPNWGLPGGFLKRREAPDDGARREVREEVGLAVELSSGPAVVVSPRWRRVDLIYRARPAEGVDPDGVVPVSAEILEVAWCSPTDLPRLQEEATDALVALARWAAPGDAAVRP